MSNSGLTDQLFLAFSLLMQTGHIVVQYEDISPISNFYNLLAKGQAFTQSQSQFMLRLLTKYRDQLERQSLDTDSIDNPKWSQPFRVIDTSKKIYVESGNQGVLICVKQPFSVKEAFEKHCLKENTEWRHAAWHPDDRVRKYNIKTLNPILVKEFAARHKYEMTEDFLMLVENVEQIYEDQEKYSPYCFVNDNGTVELANCAESAKKYFDEHKTNVIDDDLLLAKSLGFTYNYADRAVVGKICNNNTNFFWIKDLHKFVDLSFKVTGQVVLILTKEKSKNYISNLLKTIEQRGYSKNKVKIGFRANSNEDSEFNDWIRHEGLGGDLSEGKILIFKDKVPKWLIEKNIDVTIIASAGPFLPSSAMSQSWINQQSCVIFLGDIKPSSAKGQKIVEL